MTMGTIGKSAVTLAEALEPRPSDLTRLEARLGGAYSLDRIMRAIDGRRVPLRAPGLARSAVMPHHKSEDGQ